MSLAAHKIAALRFSLGFGKILGACHRRRRREEAFSATRRTARTLDIGGHRGILSYEPTELVITARAGTPLVEIEAALAEQNQMLGFEPPHFAVAASEGVALRLEESGATLGGTIAGLSGPRRPRAGSARDFVLGTKPLNGQGEILTPAGR